MLVSTMTNDEYAQARRDLKLKVPDWIEKLGLTLDIHKNYNCGREPIPQTVACHIKTLQQAKLLEDALCRVIGNFSNP